MPRPSDRPAVETAAQNDEDDPQIATAFADTNEPTSSGAANAIDKAIRKISGIPVPLPRPNVQEGDNEGVDPADQTNEAGNS